MLINLAFDSFPVYMNNSKRARQSIKVIGEQFYCLHIKRLSLRGAITALTGVPTTIGVMLSSGLWPLSASFDDLVICLHSEEAIMIVLNVKFFFCLPFIGHSQSGVIQADF